MGGEDTRRQLLAATLTAIREVGFTGLSARAVAGVAGVNQALIFYHFGSMEQLVAEACRRATAERVARWVGELEQVQDLMTLVVLARRLHAREAAEGNVAVLAQALAVAQTDARLAGVVGEALILWLKPLEATAARIVQGTILESLLSPADIARMVAAAFVGVELFEGVVPETDRDAFEVLEGLAALAAVALDAGPVTRAAVRRRLRTALDAPAGKGSQR